jgi:hypothetical protein
MGERGGQEPSRRGDVTHPKVVRFKRHIHVDVQNWDG